MMSKSSSRVHKTRTYWLSLFAVCALSLSPLHAIPPEISPPFGLRWGENDVHITELLKGAKATITDKRTIDGREAWTVEGLLQAGLKRAVFYFQQNQLVEVELQYQNDAWDVAKYDEFMRTVRNKVEEKYGPGQLIARTKGPVDANVPATTAKASPSPSPSSEASPSPSVKPDSTATPSASPKPSATPDDATADGNSEPSAEASPAPTISGITQTVVGYKWEENNTAIELFYYSAEKGDESFRTVSVHYRVE